MHRKHRRLLLSHLDKVGLSKCGAVSGPLWLCWLLLAAGPIIAVGASSGNNQVVHVALDFGGTPEAIQTPDTTQLGIGGASTTLCPTDKTGQIKLGPPTYCITLTTSEVDINFVTRDPQLANLLAAPGDSRKLLCLQTPATESSNIEVTITVTSPKRHDPIYCQIDASVIYASGRETGATKLMQARPGSIPPKTVPLAGAGAIAVPWSLLHLSIGLNSITVEFRPRSGPREVKCFIAATEDGGYGAPLLSLNYAPFIGLSTPAPTSGAAGSSPRIHDIGFDLLYQPNQSNILGASFAQNDATVATDGNFSQIVSNSLFPLPSPPPTNAQTLQTQSAFFPFPGGATALKDTFVSALVSVAPFDFSKVGSLDGGAAYSYSNPTANASVFYGLSQPNWYEAFMGQVIIPQPTMRPSQNRLLPQPTPAPTPPQAPALPPHVAQGALTSYLSLNNEAVAASSPTMISFIDAITKTAAGISSVAGLAFNTTGYQSDCSAGSTHCSQTLQLMGSFAYQPDAAFRAKSWAFGGESWTLTSATDKPTFLQISETFALQQSDEFFSPVAGDSGPFTPLSGPIGHVTLIFGSNNEGVASLDLGGYRMTSSFGDIATEESWTVGLPIPRAPTVSLRLGSQTQSISSRIAALQQGILSGYSSAFPEPPNATATPAPQPSVFAQDVREAVVAYKDTYKNIGYEIDAGALNGRGPICTAASPAPTPAPPTPGPTFGCIAQNQRTTQFTGALMLKPISGLQLGAVYASSQTLEGVSGPIGSRGTANTQVPGTTTGYAFYSGGCFTGQLGYGNAAYLTNVPLPQRGSTVAGELDVPLKMFDVGFGYFNAVVPDAPTNNQQGEYVLLRVSGRISRDPGANDRQSCLP
jgi:hypothetical protein